MKIIKNPKAGMIYQITKDGKVITGILLSTENHPGSESPYYTFYTTENNTYESYADGMTIESGVILKENVRILLKDYYQLQVNMMELEQQQKTIDEQKGLIWSKQRKIMMNMDTINGVENTTDWLNVMHQPEEPDIVKEKIQIAAENVAETAKSIRNSWVGESIYEKLNNFFDSMWERIDQRQEKKETAAKVNCHTL